MAGTPPTVKTATTETAVPSRDNAPTDDYIPIMSIGMQRYLERAMGVLQKLGVEHVSGTQGELAKLLDEVKYVDKTKVLFIAKTISHLGTFNSLVRDSVENISIGNRYLEITQAFDSIRDDSKTLIKQLDDGKFSLTEKAQNLWMRLCRGTPSERFEKIMDLYKDVTADTRNELEREQSIMDGYIDFRFALKEAEDLSRELLNQHAPTLEAVKAAFAKSQEAVTVAIGADESSRSRLEQTRDEARNACEKEERTNQLLKDVSENLSIGYNMSETLVTKLKQTHDAKDQIYRRSVTFFTSNENVFTILGTVYTSKQVLNESSQGAKNAINTGMDYSAELERNLERAALKAGYGSTISLQSVEKLVSAITDFQVESLHLIANLRKESDQNVNEIRLVVEQGKKKFQETLAFFGVDEAT